MPEKNHWAYRVAEWIREKGVFTAERVVYLLAGASLSHTLTAHAYPSSPPFLMPLWGWWLTTGGLILTLLYTISAARGHRTTLSDKVDEIDRLNGTISEKQARIEELESQTEELEAELGDFLETYLRTLAISLGFREDDRHTERITLYSYDEQKERFVNHKRYSLNENLRKKNRLSYPEDQGCIGEAWRHGEVYEQFPDPEEEWDLYLEKSKDYGLTKEEVESIRMKSRLYYGWRVMSLNGRRGLAVILVESKDPQRWDEKEIRDFFADKKLEIREYVNQFATRLPEPTVAEQREY